MSFVTTVASVAYGGDYPGPSVDGNALHRAESPDRTEGRYPTDGLYQTETRGGVPAAAAAAGGLSPAAHRRPGPDGPAAIGPGFEVDPQAVGSLAARIAESGDQAASIVAALRADLAAAGMPWGTDGLGWDTRRLHQHTDHATAGHADSGTFPR